MTFEPTTPAIVETIRARMPLDHPAATHPSHVKGVGPARIAALLYAEHHRAVTLAVPDGPFAINCCRVLTKAGLRIGDALDRPDALAEVRAELRRLVEAGTAARLDPEHQAAVRAESANCCRPVRARTESEGA